MLLYLLFNGEVQVLKKIKYEKIFFFLYSIIIGSYVCSQVYLIGNLLNYLQKAALVCLIVLALSYNSKYTIKQIFTLGLVGIAFVLGVLINRNFALLLMFVIIWVSMPVDFERFVNFDFKLRIHLYSVVIVFYLLGFTDNYIMTRTDGTIRTSMGFDHPNTLGAFAFLFCAELFMLQKKRPRWYQIILMIMLVLIADQFSDSRTSLACSIVIIIVSLYSESVKKILSLKFARLICYLFFPLMTGISYILTILYDRGSWLAYTLNYIVSYRIKFSSQFLDTYGISLLGNNIELISSKQQTSTWVLDNSYMYILIRFGLIAWLFMCLAYYLIFRWIFEKKKYQYVVPIIAIQILGLMSVCLTSMKYNVFILLIGNVLNNNLLIRQRRGERVIDCS